MRFDVITIFPDMFGPVFRQGVVGRAVERGVIEVHTHDLRDFTHDRHRQVDDVPFGGGPGMVMKPEPVFEAVESVMLNNAGPVVLLEPWGRRLDQGLAAELAREPGLIIVCGRYEGIDDRVRTGLASMVLIDTVGRLVPGVVGDPESLEQDTFGGELAGCPQFTRPAEYRGMRVPDVLLSGDHARIRQWRRQQAAQRQTPMAHRS